jgi:membrane protein DedA with SNARE-associated domain
MSFVENLVETYGLIVVGGVILLESLGLPVPGETVLIIASIYAGTSHPHLDIVEVILTAAGAGLVGQMIGYVIGHEFGYWLLLRYGPYVRITESRIKLGEYLFLRHGGKIVFVSRFVPVLRSIAGILAGANRMPWRQFLFANAVGALAWASFFGFAAYMLGHQVEHLAGPMVIVLGVVVLILIIVGIIFVGRHEAQLAAEAERALPGPLKLR